MTAKEYLSQARTLDMRIKSKLQQIESLNELATSCTVVYSDMPRNPNRGGSKVERAVLKIIEVEESLKHDVEDLVELKKEIMATIQAVSDVSPLPTRNCKPCWRSVICASSRGRKLRLRCITASSTFTGCTIRPFPVWLPS